MYTVWICTSKIKCIKLSRSIVHKWQKKYKRIVHKKIKIMFKNLELIHILSTYVGNLEHFQKLFMKNMICKNINASKKLLTY